MTTGFHTVTVKSGQGFHAEEDMQNYIGTSTFTTVITKLKYIYYERTMNVDIFQKLTAPEPHWWYNGQRDRFECG